MNDIFILIISAIGLIVLVFFVIENNQLDFEYMQLKNKIKELEEKIENENKEDFK